MKLGRKPKTTRGWTTAGVKVKPKNVPADSIVGRISSDWVIDVFRPKFIDLASSTLEQYAEDCLLHELSQQEAQINADGTTVVSQPNKPLFHSQYQIDEFDRVLSETSQHFFAPKGGWRVHANAARFERNLDEKYGIFRPFITQHPEIETFVRNVQRKYVLGEFSPLRKPPIPRSTAVIILFMMTRGNLGWQVMLLAFLFLLVGLQPWALVGLVMVLHTIKNRRLRQRVGTMPKRIPTFTPYYQKPQGEQEETPEQEKQRKRQLLLRPVGMPLGQDETPIDTSHYDTILLGSGAATLFAAALLSRAGRKVLVVCPNHDASDVEDIDGVPVDMGSMNITRIAKQQAFLAPALCTENDCQGGIRFAQIGTEADGHAFQILSIPGVGADKASDQIPFVLKAAGGTYSLMTDAATDLGDGWPGSDGSAGDSAVGAYIDALESLNATAGAFYLSKILPESANKYQSKSSYQTVSVQYAESILNQCFPLNTHTRSLMAGAGLPGENLRPSKASMAVHVTNLCGALSWEGMHYPIGGSRALCHALANTIEKSGGRIVTGLHLKELVFVEPSGGDDEKKSSEKPSCVGVRLMSGQEIVFAADRFRGKANDPVVVSMLTFIDTFVRIMPAEIRTKYGHPEGLGALQEQRPVVKFAYSLKGSARDLDLTGADFYRLPGAARALDEINPSSNTIRHGEIGWEDEDEQRVSGVAETVTDLSGEDRKRRKHRQKQFEPGVSWMHIAFPSAKDPSFSSLHPNMSTCVITVEADDELVADMGTNPRIFQTKQSNPKLFLENLKNLQRKVEEELIELYPQLEGKLIAGKLEGPQSMGLSHTPERYAAKGVRVDTPYKHLLYGGSDVTIGGSFSASLVAAWLAANAVVGYSTFDHLFYQKNITTDLARFMDSPGEDEDDLAVPYSIPDVPHDKNLY
ncbi:hypothetical protein FisN_28Lh041 [Fistulifera solaris]|uniref:Uncharacterized protein n=1 Tax=Fistulifera solaris TaxID=1519565 RepID=A0A1Z5KSC2_FISSO|nr:hypothetical protein FisN_28Lh041 [Fistulifera solaris]|eukprot:GAX29213.1 hypothetical protein FisN_28Lh041 [Fistulifera solaris]